MRQFMSLIIAVCILVMGGAPAFAQAPTGKYTGTDFMREGRDAFTGYPSNYEETTLCKPYEYIGPFKNIFIAKAFPPGFRAMLVKTITDNNAGTIVTDSTKADYLIELDGTGLEVGFYRTFLWAVNSRPKGAKMGLRCLVSSSFQLNDKPIDFKEIVGFILVNAIGDQGPRHFAYRGRYDSKPKCYGYFDDTEILAFKKIYLELDTPANLREYMAAQIATNPNFQIVTKSSDADYMVSIKRDAGKVTTTTQGADYIQWDWSTDRAYKRSGEVTTSTSYYDVGELTIRGVKHPADASSLGMFCDIYSKRANKVSGLIGKATKDPGKRLTAELLQFLSKPDLSYGMKTGKR